MTSYEIPLMDMGDYIVEIGAVIFVLGITALGGAILLIKDSFQNIETKSSLHFAISMAFQVIGGAVGWLALNGLVYYVGFLSLDRFCVDKDNIACGMVVLIALFWAVVLLNIGSVIGILVLILFKKRGIAGGALLVLLNFDIKMSGVRRL